MRNIIVFVLLFCSSLILSAQNKSSQFEHKGGETMRVKVRSV